jgi:hypothetical protein
MIVSGSVLDNEMGIVPFANIEVVGENRAVAADASGRFTVKVNSSASILRFSHAGFDYDEISAGEFLKEGYVQLYPTTLDEIVIINPAAKKSNNTVLWVFAGIAAAYLLFQGTRSSKNKSVKVTV